MSSQRLQQILARAGIASRRKAEVLIAEGRVAVNGRVVATLGARADPAVDVVSVDGERVGPAQERATIMLHKPMSVMTTLDDPEERETVVDLIRDEPYRFVPVGRLDFLTEGLLLLTTDGELVHHLLHPSYHVPKVYQVKVRGRLARSALDRLRDGVTLEDGPTRPTVVEVLEELPTATWLEIVVTEGRNRLVRRMVEAVGHPAHRVVRTEMATLELGDLKPGQYRYLGAEELRALYRTAHLSPEKVSARAEEVGTRVLGRARRGRGALPGASSSSPYRSNEGSSTAAIGRSSGGRGPRRSNAASGRGRSAGEGRPRRSSGPGRSHRGGRPRRPKER